MGWPSLSEYPTSSLQNAGAVIVCFLTSLAVIAVGLRVYSRCCKKQFGLDDSLVCIATILLVAETGATYMGLRTSFQGIHEKDIPADLGLSYGLFWTYIMEAIYNPILALVKTSILMFLLRLGAGVDNCTRWMIHGVNFWNIAQFISTLLVVIFQCSPPSYFWLHADPTSGVTGTCIQKGVFYTSTAGLTVVSDIMTLWIPIQVFGRLQMQLKMRLALISLFCIGGSVLILSTLRMMWVVQHNFYNLTTYNIGIVYSVCECALAVIASCGPALRPLFAKWFPGCFDSLAGTEDRYGPQAYDQYPSHSHSRLTSLHGGKGRVLMPPSTIGTQRFNGYPEYALQTMHRSHAEVGGASMPNGSDEAIIPHNGILMTREYEVNSETTSDEQVGRAA